MLTISGVATSYLVFASVDTTVYRSESIKIIPETLETNGWIAIENALVQDLTPNSLYQSFTKQNSASLPFFDISRALREEREKEEMAEQAAQAASKDKETLDSETEEVMVGDDASDVGGVSATAATESSSSSESGIPMERDAEQEILDENDLLLDEVIESEEGETEQDDSGVVSSEDEVGEDEAESETSAEENVVSTLQTGFTKFTSAFSFMYEEIVTQFTTDEIVSSTAPVEIVWEEDVELDSLGTTTSGESVEETVQDASNIEQAEISESLAETGISTTYDEESTESGATTTLDEVLVEEVPELPNSASTTMQATTSEEGEVEATSSSTVDNFTSEQDDTTVLSATTTLDAALELRDCLEDDDCHRYWLEFNDFSVPPLEAGSYIENAQIRLSLAGATGQLGINTIQRLRIQYTFGSGWIDAGVLDLTEEISNSINGGYYLYALPQVKNVNALDSLLVRVVYEGDPEKMNSLYVDSLWLELEAGSLHEPVDSSEFTDEIEYSRDLLAPTINEFIEEPKDFGVGTLPFFNLKYNSQENFFERTFEKFFGGANYEVDRIELEHPELGQIPVDYKIDYHDNGSWTIHIERQPQKIKPGKYEVHIFMKEDEKVHEDVFEFYWGVLAINTTKSMYHPDEEVTLNLAALTDKGNTICDADLRLKIIDSEYNIFDVPVEQSGVCGANNVTDVPDYFAIFENTKELGTYEMQLEHYNKFGEMVHRVVDNFEVLEYIPFDIERSAPTRIYPPSPYEVTLNIKANRSFTGDITERVPKGFVITDMGEATLTSLPLYSEITWSDVSISEGDSIVLSYTFDAPDISPYLYLLGPLDMDGFKERRQWQIASDALGGIAWLTGYQTTSGVDINDSAAAMLWSTSTLDSYYFSHSTSSEPNKLTINRDGDYLVTVTVPQVRTDSNNGSRTRVGAEVRVNGVAQPGGYARSSYIRNDNNQNESSSHLAYLIPNLAADDYVEIFLEGLATVDAGDNVEISGQAGFYVEYVSSGETVFAATTTRSVASTSLNLVASSEMEWSEQRQDTGFVHSDSVNPEDIVISNAGSYLVTINIPITAVASSTDDGADERNNILGRVLLDGVEVLGGQFAQGYTRGPDVESDDEGSIHWSGIVTSTTTNQVLSVSVEREAIDGVVIVTPGAVGSIFVRELPATDVIVLRGTELSGGSDWSNSPAESILWESQDVIDGSTFTHSTSSNTEQITIDVDGDYFLVYNDAMTSNTGRGNIKITVEVDGTPVVGAETKSQYTRNGTSNVTSGSLTYLLEGLSSGQVVTLYSEQEGNGATFNDTTDAMLMLWKKAELNLRPETFTFYDTPFDNIRTASTTPVFEFSTVDPDGTSDLVYQISFSTSTNFVASTTRETGADSGFSNLDTGADTSPFNEGERIRFQPQPGDSFADETTYYWRVRATDVTGSGEYGDWSTIQSFTIDAAATTDYWYQSLDGQFDTDTLTGLRSSGSDSVEVDVVDNSEILLVYGEDGDTTPKYRFWDGSVWGTESTALDVGGTDIDWVVTSAASTREEYALGTLSEDGEVNFQIYDSDAASWGDLNEIADTASNTYRGVAIAYETVSGDAMAVACNGVSDPVYSIWNGTNWSATSSINVTTTSNCNYLTISSDPNSDEMIIVVRGAADEYEALVWDGDAWGDAQTIGRFPNNSYDEGMSVMYEASGNQAMVVTSDAGDNEFMYTTWDGSTWSTALQVPLSSAAADYDNGFLKRDDDTDNIVLCFHDTANDAQAIIWDGDTWGSEVELTNDLRGMRSVDCEYETTAGRDGYILASYTDNGDNNDYYSYYDTSSWTGPLTGAGIPGDTELVDMERAGDGTIVVVHFNDQDTQLDTSTWNGSAWSDYETLEANPSNITSQNPALQSYFLSAKTFQYAQGTILTNPIDFSFVPNQLTWGDIQYNVTEPTGTNVSVQIYYTNSLTCDTLIPDIDLPDNSIGLAATSSPIDISGLSTTTYSQICLEATINTNGSNSATLDDWTVTWVREANLIQNNYQWYDNLSALTPTDPWPAGLSDVLENAPITETESVSVGDELRLRMSIQGSNVDLATSSEVFKLQFSERGNSCDLATGWSDVGGIGSTTALWRGYANSIVGDDWLDEDWGRRISITIDNSDVGDDLVDFPVYVDLGDLPTGFFSNIQSQGQDIRVTQDDGVTEVPFEIVSINTGGETGELHFKANALASTTDSTFYIYYDNSGASAYAVSATYGSENVWTNNFELRYPLDEDPTGSVPQFKDSTSNSVDSAARSGMTVGDVIAGQIGDALNLDGNDGGVFESGLTFSGEYTISTWWRSSGNGFAFSSNAGANEKIGPWTGSGSNMFFRVLPGGSNDQTVARPSNGSWHHVVVTRDSSNKIDFYVDGGSPTRLFSDSAQSGNANWENFGGQTSQGFNGDMDELRFASVKRSDDWVTTEYNNQANTLGFYTVSAEELISDGRSLPSTLLSESVYPETYEEENPTRSNQHAIVVGNDLEWDFVLEANAPVAGTDYCFRMVYENGGALYSYNNYPTLVTNGPPNAPELSAPFDNEQLASTSPWFEFAAEDPVGDEVAYQIQIDTDYSFGSPDVDDDSVTEFIKFENIANTSDKSPFSSGQTIRYIPTVSLSDSTTYWWRVRAQDPDASGTYGDWSTPASFTVDSATTITTWFQTTEEQFDTNDLESLESNAADDLRLAVSETYGTTTSTSIAYDDVDTGNAWGEFSFTNTLNGGTVSYFIEYETVPDSWSLIPDSQVPGNSSGLTSSPVNLVTLDTDVYSTIRLVATFDGTSGSPELEDWTVTWGERVDVPTTISPFDNAKVATVTPELTFYSTDPDGDALEYQLQLSTTSSFTSSSTFNSNVDSGFLDVLTGSTTSPFDSGNSISYRIQTPLTSSSTYWWRLRARDPLGDNVYSLWSDAQSFTVDESIAVSTWYQTTGEQFFTDTLTDMETASSSVKITTSVREVMATYSETGSFAPRYIFWDGSAWGDEFSAESINSYPVFSELQANPARDEYALATVGEDLDINVQIYSGASSTWGNVFEITANASESQGNNQPFDIAYENSSGDLLAVACRGSDAVYTVWDGSNWSATSTIALSNTNDCRHVDMASDPNSDEIILGVQHVFDGTGAATGPLDNEFVIWSGSAWGNNNVFGHSESNSTKSIAVEYETSGDQALAVTGWEQNGGTEGFRFTTWDGSSWGASSTLALEANNVNGRWSQIAADPNSDNMMLCYMDDDNDLGVIEWDGANFDGGGVSEYETTAETGGRPFHCAYENDGDVIVVYSDNASGNYQEVIAGTPQGELPLPSERRSDYVTSVRAEDGVILSGFMEFQGPDTYRAADWDGSSWTSTALSVIPSDTTNPFTENLAFAARLYPNFDTGQVQSTVIDYDDGTGPRWEQVLFDDVTPGSSSIIYQVYYNDGSNYSLVPDVYLSGNSSGFTTSPIDISSLDKALHNELILEADFLCVLGECPTLNDWTVEWSEGITVSGTAYEYDESTLQTSGSVAVAVNGVLQSGRTGSIAGDGTWSINNVTIFEGDEIIVFIDGVVADADEAVGATRYDGNGDITGMVLSKRHLTVGSNDTSIVVTNAGLDDYDFSDNENVFFAVDGSDVLTLCADVGCADSELKVLSGATYKPGANSIVHDIENQGTLDLDATTLRVGGSWVNSATTSFDTSTVVFTATSSTETLSGTTSLEFYDLTFGETSGSATWNNLGTLDVANNLSVSYGVLGRATTSIYIEGNLVIDPNGYFSGIGTTTFDGSGVNTWTDNKASSTNVGRVLVDGTSKTVSISSDVLAEQFVIGSDDTLRGGTGNTVRVIGDFLNNNLFIGDTSNVMFISTSSAFITLNDSSFYDVTFSGSGGVWSFTEALVDVDNDFTIATGTVTLPTGTTTVGGSFANSGGTFVHNNGLVVFDSASAGETIALAGTPLYNAFYDVHFDGSGDWSFTDSTATTTNDFIIQNGSVTLPSGTLTVGADFLVTSGSFAHNDGEVVLLIQDSDTVTTNSSSFNNLRLRAGSSGSWYSDSWAYRIPITIDSSQVDDDLSNFPTYVDLSDLSSTFFSNVKADGSDIRVTESDGTTEIPFELASINTGTMVGELYFRSTSISSTSDSVFYIYYGNAGASAYAQGDPYGENAVWSNGFTLVEHFDDLTTASVENSVGSPDGSKTSANNPLEDAVGKLYEAQDFSGDSIGHNGSGVMTGESNISFSAWVKADDLTGSGDTATYGFSIFAISPSGAPYTWLTAGGTGYTDEFRLCAWENSPTSCTGTTGSDLATDQWYHISVAAVDGGLSTVRVNGVETLSFTNAGSGSLGNNFTIGDLRPGRNINWNGLIDEVRVSNVIRSDAWRDAEYRNTSTTTTFYSDGAQEVSSLRIFADTNTSVLGDYVAETGGDARFPSGVLSVGGSFDNNAEFDANGGTVRFNSIDSGETIAAGVSSFGTLEFNGSTGGFTVTEHATASTAVVLSTVGDFTVDAGVVLESTGTFTNTANNASTTWNGSLRLSGDNDFAINSKTDDGDDYGVLTIVSDGDVNVWNSTVASPDLQDTASLYSQDHAGTVGDLYIYGDYIRESGTEYWSYATDWDGTDLSGGNERQANVRIAGGASLTASSSVLEIVGSSTASTTIASVSGNYSLTLQTATVTAQYFTVADGDATGFNFTSSTTVTQLDDFSFAIPGSSSGITVDSATIDTNPAMEFFNTNFVTAGGNVNVTLSGSPSSYWWFRDGSGDRYGEAYDNSDGDPGSIRWDDSSYDIAISGIVYSDDGSSAMGGPTCDGTTQNVRVVIDGGTFASTTSCSGVDGSYNFSSVQYVGDPSVVVYLDTDGGEYGSVITKTPSGSVNNLDVYANRIMTRHEGITALSISDMVDYDFDDDTDLRFTAATGTTDTLVVMPNTELIVASSTTFIPGGDVTLQSGGTGATYDGSLHVDDNSVLVAADNESYIVGGSLFVDTGGTFTNASTSFIFSATTSGKTITSEDVTTLSFETVDFVGVGGGWNINTDISLQADLTVATGTVTGTGDVTLQNGSFTGNGLVVLGGGTTQIVNSAELGGEQGWTFYNLTLGDGVLVGTTTRTNVATTSVAGLLTISSGHFLDAGSSLWNLSGSGTVFVENGTFLEDTSTVVYSGAAATNVLSTPYYNLYLRAAAGTPTYTLGALGLPIANDLQVGGAAPTTVTLDTNDPVVSVLGDVSISSTGTLIGSDAESLTLHGDWDNDGTYTSSDGEVRFVSSDAYSISAGASPFADMTLLGGGAGDFIESATSTGQLTFGTSSDVTVQPGQVLAVGGQFSNESGGLATTWTNATLYLYGGGDYEVNSKTIDDSYGNIIVGSNTDIRLWNSVASSTLVANDASVYSMDHNDVTGDLYIYGAYEEDTRSDYWNYATDFDGTDLTGGGERGVDVYFASGASALWTNGSITAVGTSSATTTLQNQGSGTFSITASGTATFEWNTVAVRDIDSSGVVFGGTPTINDFSNTDLLAEINSGYMITVEGTVITANPGQNFNNNSFNDDVGVTNSVNVSLSGSTISAWRFTGHTGDRDGESFDDDSGDPGEIIWDDSSPIYSISGTVYQSNRTATSTVCDGVTNNIFLAIDGSIAQSASTSCSSADGSYSITDISFDSNDVLTVFIDGESNKGVTVSVDSIGSIGNMDIYENHVIVRHESPSPISISDLAIFDSSNDTDIQFTAIDAVTDTLTVLADNQLLVWTNKQFTPNGLITLSGGGSGASYDGTFELLDDATFTGNNSETYFVGGSMIFADGATMSANNSTTTFTSNAAGKTIDVNNESFNNLQFTGSGGWTIVDTTLSSVDLDISAGTLTLPSATTTIAGSFINSGTFNANGGIAVFTSTDSGETVTLGGSDLNRVIFDGVGGAWDMSDTNATTTDSLIIENGTLTLPSGVLAVAGDFRNNGGSLVHNSSELFLSSATSTLLANGSDLHSVTMNADGPFTMADMDLTLLGSLTIEQGEVALPTGTLTIGGSLLATGSTFDSATGTILFNSDDTGEVVNVGDNDLYNAVFSNVAGGWTLSSATTTNNFTLTNALDFVMGSGETLVVSGVFTNSVGGVVTTWDNSTLKLNSGTEYSINTKSDSGDEYDTLHITAGTDIRAWNSRSTTSAVDLSASLYSQDHAAADGDLYIFGDFNISTRTEYWSYATDFDGVALSGINQRSAAVYAGQSSLTTSEISLNTGGTLNIIGSTGATTSVQSASSTLTFPFSVTGGSLDMNYYSFDHLDAYGLNISGVPTLGTMDNGSYEVGTLFGNAMTLSSTTLNANASKVISNVSFNSDLGGNNIELTGTTSNAWSIQDTTGNLDGEDYDVDGLTDCGSLRWDDSSCQLIQQSDYRWRNDDGGEGVPASEWFDVDWDKRKRVRLTNEVNTTYATTAVKIAVTYDSDMLATFDDLRFTDSDGVTEVPYWIERYTASTDAVVWVQTPSLPASSQKDLFMYYDNVLATTTSSSSNVFAAVDDFEDGDISEYTGDTGLFTVGNSFAYGGSNGLDMTGFEGTRATDGIGRTDITVSQGQIIRYMQYVDTGFVDEACTMFGIQSVAGNTNYGVCLEQYGTDRISLVRNVESTDSYPNVVSLSSSNVTYSTGWYEVLIDWQTDDSIGVSLYTDAGTLVATTSATDSSYTSGGVGFTAWGQNGGWDDLVAYTRVEQAPTVKFGNEQTDGGATWASAQNTAGSGFDVGDVARLRLAVENTGLDQTDQEFLLEFATKGASPNCEAVSSGSYVAVPPQSTCSGSAICMSTSSNFTNGAATNDHLSETVGTFASGEMVEDPDNETSAYDVNQDEYTEVEYAITLTNDASSDAYCFRLTDAGTELDSYSVIAELSLQFDPSFGAVTLNNGDPITLEVGTTTRVYATSTVTDLNGFADLASGSSTVYRSGAGAACVADNNNCYISTGAPQCTFADCAGNSCTLSCYSDIYYHADPTDTGTYDGEEWLAYLEVVDQSGGTDLGSALGVELLTLRAINVSESIDYGSLLVAADTGSYNATTTVANQGNDALDVAISGADLTDGSSSVIPATQQIFATSTFNYTTCTFCTVATSSGVNYELDLNKPTTTSPVTTDEVFWGISVPFGAASNPHSGITNFMAIGD